MTKEQSAMVCYCLASHAPSVASRPVTCTRHMQLSNVPCTSPVTCTQHIHVSPVPAHTRSTSMCHMQLSQAPAFIPLLQCRQQLLIPMLSRMLYTNTHLPLSTSCTVLRHNPLLWFSGVPHRGRHSPQVFPCVPLCQAAAALDQEQAQRAEQQQAHGCSTGQQQQCSEQSITIATQAAARRASHAP